MKAKSVIYYLFLMIISLLHQGLTAILYPLVYAFRYKIIKYAERRIYEDTETKLFKLRKNVKKWHLYINPLFWGFLFTTGLTYNFSGPFWFKKDLKEKWFDNDDDHTRFKYRIRFFYLSYLWGGLRNSGYAFSQWFLCEGDAIADSIKVYKCNTVKDISLIEMPNAKFKDEFGNDMNNSGTYIKYPFDDPGESGVTIEGTKILLFRTYIGKERFKYAFTKIYKLSKIKKFLVIELIYGWDTWDGMAYLHSKFMFKKINTISESDYNRYINE